MEIGPTQALANFASTCSYEIIPPETREKQKELLLDLLGCALGAVKTPEGLSALQAVSELENGEGPAALWGTSRRASAAGAALMNGILAHTLESDDTHAEGCIHPGAPIIPAAVAVGEAVKASGKDLLAAIVIGYEVGIRIAIGVGPVSHRMHGWHATGTCGAFGAAAATGKLLQLTPQQMAWALGLAGVQHTGTWVFTDDGSMCKRFHAGQAAQGGVNAAYLAWAGFTGPTRVLEAKDGGFFATTSDEYDISRVAKGLGEKYEAALTSPKPFSCCRHTHSTLDAVLRLVSKNSFKPEDVREVFVKTNSSAFKSVGKIVEPQTITEAQFSLPFLIGLAILEKRVFQDQFTMEKIKNPQILTLARKVKISVDPVVDRNYPEHWSSDVRITTSAGNELKMFVKDAPGELGNPLPKNLVQEKYQSLAKAALSPERIEKVEKMVLHMEGIKNVRDLGSLLGKD
jgi:2-methylcitrate dehydratase PrpD